MGSGSSVTASYSYTPYGASLKTGIDDTSYQFTARENDGAAELYYHRARYYVPALNRFASEDPITFAGGENFYQYAQANPVMFFDPDGFEPRNRGERGYTRSPSGTSDAYKHYSPHPTDPNKVIYKDPQTGKKIEKPRPADYTPKKKTPRPAPPPAQPTPPAAPTPQPSSPARVRGPSKNGMGLAVPILLGQVCTTVGGLLYSPSLGDADRDYSSDDPNAGQ